MKPIYLVVNCTTFSVDIRGHIIKNIKEATELKKYYEDSFGCYENNIIFTNSEEDYNLFMDDFVKADSDTFESILSLAQVKAHFNTYGEIKICLDKYGHELEIGNIVKLENKTFGKIKNFIRESEIEINLLKEDKNNETLEQCPFGTYKLTIDLSGSTETKIVDSSVVVKVL